MYDSAIKQIGAKGIRIVDYAREAGLLGDYYSSYSQLCSSVHSGPEDLEAYFHKDEQGHVVAVGPPKKENAEILLVSAVEAMIRILRAASTIFGVSIHELEEADDLCRQAAAIAWGPHLPAAGRSADSH